MACSRQQLILRELSDTVISINWPMLNYNVCNATRACRFEGPTRGGSHFQVSRRGCRANIFMLDQPMNIGNEPNCLRNTSRFPH
jgi:hypothetical protein